jgi:predicted acetyltransferase
MDQIVRLTAADFTDAMDFCNMVFSMSSRPHHFQSLLPKLYQPDDEKMHAHFAIRRDGRIRALIGMYPMTLRVGAQQLKVAGIGGVGTHPDERKSGLMRQLMTAIVDEMKQQQIALSVLGGQRQRYGYYGYEPAGASLTFSLSKTNLKHFFRDRDFATVRFEMLDPENDKNNSCLTLMKRWHNQQPVHVERPADSFLTILSSWYARVWLARDAGGEAIGYLVSNREGNAVSELISEKPDSLLSIAASWVDQQEKASIDFSLAPWQQDAIADLGRIAEHCRFQPAYAFRINDWPLLLTALLDVKASLQDIPDGQIRLGIEDQGQVSVFALERLNKASSCRLCARDEADLVLDRLTATRFLLGPLSPPFVVPKHLPGDLALRQLLSLWLPLPLFWSSPDCI